MLTNRYSFGASLSYASSDGQSGAASPQVLSNAMIEDDTEVVIMTNQSCDDGGCAYTRPGGVAYRKSCLRFVSVLSRLLKVEAIRWFRRRAEDLSPRVFDASYGFRRFQRRYARYLASERADTFDVAVWY